MSLPAAKSIYNYLVTPSKVAHALDWRKASGAVLSLRIVKDRLDLAVSSHPEAEEPTYSLPSIPLEYQTINNRKTLLPKVSRELTEVIQKYHVCGMVVSWPVQTEGWCGKSCGTVLHVLDQLASQGLPNRPICLFEPTHASPPEDEWGRATLYSEPAKQDQTMHLASRDQYGQEHTTVTGKMAADLWKQYVQEQWPELSRVDSQQQPYALPSEYGRASTSTTTQKNTYSFDYLVDDDDEYVTATA